VNRTERFNKKIKEVLPLIWGSNVKIDYMTADEVKAAAKTKQLKNVYTIYHDYDAHSTRGYANPALGLNHTTETYFADALVCAYYNPKGKAHILGYCDLTNDPGKYEIGGVLLQIKRKVADKKTYLDGYKQIADKILLIDEDLLSSDNTKEKVSQLYKYPVQVSTEKEMESKLLSKDNKYAFMLVVPLPIIGEGGFCLMIINIDGTIVDFETYPNMGFHLDNRYNDSKYIGFLGPNSMKIINTEIEKAIAKSKK
jgi:hypothetical protein